ncbi:MAG: outer membrane protein [Desulfobacterales bacterium]
MKKLVFLFTALLLLSVPMDVIAEGMSYVSGSVGGVYADDLEIEFGDGALLDFEFDEGYAFSAAIGGFLFDNWRAEAELAYQKNDFDKVSLAGSESADLDGDLDAWTFLGNFYYDFHNSTPFTPFLTAGIGGAFVEVTDLRSEAFESAHLAGGDDFGFAYQAGAGLAWQVSEKLNVDFKYRWLGMDEADTRIPDTEFNSHNFYAGLRFLFKP